MYITKKNNRGLSLFDIILALIVAGYLGYFSIQWYIKWSESLNWAEAVHQLKTVKSKIELCMMAKNDINSIDNCIFNSSVQEANTIHFKCCEGKNITISSQQISYEIFAIRTDHDLTISDEGGEEPVCSPDGKTQYRNRSGISLCRNFDGTYTLLGWGIYKGEYN